MEYKELIRRVQEAAHPATLEEAKTAAEVVLGTLGELLPLTERRRLGTQLPKPLKDSLDRWVGQPPREQTHPHRFRLEEFYSRVAARSGVRYPTAVKRSQAVMKALHVAVSEGELADAFHTLPQEYQELLTETPQSPASASIVE